MQLLAEYSVQLWLYRPFQAFSLLQLLLQGKTSRVLFVADKHVTVINVCNCFVKPKFPDLSHSKAGF